jgi:hypothetical protein
VPANRYPSSPRDTRSVRDEKSFTETVGRGALARCCFRPHGQAKMRHPLNPSESQRRPKVRLRPDRREPEGHVRTRHPPKSERVTKATKGEASARPEGTGRARKDQAPAKIRASHEGNQRRGFGQTGGNWKGTSKGDQRRGFGQTRGDRRAARTRHSPKSEHVTKATKGEVSARPEGTGRARPKATRGAASAKPEETGRRQGPGTR